MFRKLFNKYTLSNSIISQYSSRIITIIISIIISPILARYLGPIRLGKLSYVIALAYLLMIVGLQVFVIPNINPRKLLTSSLKYGFLFGIILYGVYDLTAGAVFKKWDFKLATMDILWGGLVYFLTCLITFKIIEALNKKKKKEIASEEHSMVSELYY